MFASQKVLGYSHASNIVSRFIFKATIPSFWFIRRYPKILMKCINID